MAREPAQPVAVARPARLGDEAVRLRVPQRGRQPLQGFHDLVQEFGRPSTGWQRCPCAAPRCPATQDCRGHLPPRRSVRQRLWRPDALGYPQAPRRCGSPPPGRKARPVAVELGRHRPLAARGGRQPACPNESMADHCAAVSQAAPAGNARAPHIFPVSMVSEESAHAFGTNSMDGGTCGWDVQHGSSLSRDGGKAPEPAGILHDSQPGRGPTMLRNLTDEIISTSRKPSPKQREWKPRQGDGAVVPSTLPLLDQARQPDSATVELRLPQATRIAGFSAWIAAMLFATPVVELASANPRPLDVHDQEAPS